MTENNTDFEAPIEQTANEVQALQEEVEAHKRDSREWMLRAFEANRKLCDTIVEYESLQAEVSAIREVLRGSLIVRIRFVVLLILGRVKRF
jgi:hypothetical protein